MAVYGNTKMIYVAVFAKIAIAVTKFIASVLTGSSAMFAEAVHSVVGTGNQLLLLFGVRQAQRPANRMHPFGHGNDLYFYAFLVAILIFGAGAGFAAYEGIEKLLHPCRVSGSYINYAVILIALVYEVWAWRMAYRTLRAASEGRSLVETIRRSKDPTLFTLLLEDSAALTGLVLAFFGIAMSHITGHSAWDAAASLAIAAVLAATAVALAIETKGLLVGEAANPRLVNRVRLAVAADRAVVDVGDVLTMHLGPNEVLTVVSADFDNSLTAKEVEGAVHRLKSRIEDMYPDIVQLYIETRALKPGSGTR